MGMAEKFIKCAAVVAETSAVASLIPTLSRVTPAVVLATYPLRTRPMAAEMKVTVQAVEAAFNAWCDVADVDEWRVRNSQEALRAALEAGLAAMLEPACYRQHQPNHSSEWFSGVAPHFESKHPAWSIEQAYTIKESTK